MPLKPDVMGFSMDDLRITGEQLGLNQKQITAAMLLGQGSKAVEAAGEVGCTPRTLTNWRKMESFNTLIRLTEEKFPLPQISPFLKEKFGISNLEELRDKLIGVLAAAAFVDPAKYFGEDGQLLPWAQIPQEVRLAVQDPPIPGNKQPLRFINKRDAINDLIVNFGLRDPRKSETKMRSIGVNLNISMSERRKQQVLEAHEREMGKQAQIEEAHTVDAEVTKDVDADEG